MLQPLRYLPHSQWVYWCSYTIFISLRRLPVNRYWCWSSLQLCAEQTTMLWSIEPLNWPHNIHQTSWYSISSKKNEGKRFSSSENSLLIVKGRDDGAGGMTGTSAGFGKRNDEGDTNTSCSYLIRPNRWGSQVRMNQGTTYITQNRKLKTQLILNIPPCFILPWRKRESHFSLACWANPTKRITFFQTRDPYVSKNRDNFQITATGQLNLETYDELVNEALCKLGFGTPGEKFWVRCVISFCKTIFI